MWTWMEFKSVAAYCCWVDSQLNSLTQDNSKRPGITYTKGICSCVSIDTLDQPLISTKLTFRSALDQNSIDILINTWSVSWLRLSQVQYSVSTQSIPWSALDRLSVNRQLSVSWLVCIDQHSMTCLEKLVDSQPTVDREVYRVSIKWQSRIARGYQLNVDWGCL